MPRFFIELSREDRDRLMELAIRERRRLRDQAAYLIEQSLNEIDKPKPLAGQLPSFTPLKVEPWRPFEPGGSASATLNTGSPHGPIMWGE